MQKFLSILLFLPLLLFSQAPANYYNGTDGLNGYDLKSKLHDIVSIKTITWHYGDLPKFYGQTDLDQYYDYDISNTTFLLDIYSNNPEGNTAYHYTKENLISSAGAEGLGYNREHMMPQSSFNSNYPMYSDLFFVIPTDARINQLRSNYPYGIAGTTNYYTFTNSSKISKNATPNSGYTGRVYEPIAEFRGDIARSLLYYVVRYEGKLNSFNFYNGTSPANDTSPLDGSEEKAFENWYVELLLKWHNEDPVSQREIDRNNMVYTIQKNRNPFIDRPEWVNAIWLQGPLVAVPQAPQNLNSTQTSAYFANLSWTQAMDQTVLGYKIYQNGIYIGYSKTPNYIVDHLTPSTLYQFTVKAYYRDYTESAESSLLSITTLAQDIYAKDLLITKYLEGIEDNKALEITNTTGHAVDLNKYRISIQFYNSVNGNYYFVAPFELEGVVENNSTFVILNPNSNFSCITNDQARFVSAAPQMTFTGSNYLELRYLSSTVDAIGTRGIDNYTTLGNLSLYRSSAITEPNYTFNLAEWQSYPTDYCENLGVLSAAEFNVSAKEDFTIYPNPLVGNTLFVKGRHLEKVQNASFLDLSGKQILKIKDPFKSGNSIEVPRLLPGVYILQLDNQTLKFIKK
ncbi:endonuclease [Kaistella antarctica]|uniref:Endonuclease I n=1 Tax=Kaistella antarctica TaxID=266748 RepID=A0A448NN13_9FLAO|nr:endonuclease [Kaistella antarctica]KEY19923.1 endonuclease I [Kaistella antarctica]SEV95842.1 Por secretion system C-terminal sorting domain-containing protein [Kaistella antarctica]VEH96081.1 Extracellular ribonuclease precursor [Kaistella antarctica]